MADIILFYLTYIIIIILLGLFCSIIAKKLKITNVLLLILTGIVLSALSYKGASLITFSPLFLTSIGTIALVMIVFDAASRIRFKEFDSFSADAIKVFLTFLVLNLVVLTPFIMFISGFEFSFYHLILSMLFAVLISGTEASSVLNTNKDVKNKAVKFLETESLLSAPIVILLSFVLLCLITNLGTGSSFEFTKNFIPFITKVVTGIGVGVLIGIIIYKLMKKYYSKELSPLAIITSALLTYILAENLMGSGALAVAALGLIFGSIYVKQKHHLIEFSSMFSSSLEIFVFILLGFVVIIPFSTDFFIKTAALFVIYIAIRYLALCICLGNKYEKREKVFMALTTPKGIVAAVVAFAFASYKLDGMSQILNFTMVFILYSIILASIAARFTPYFMKKNSAKKAVGK